METSQVKRILIVVLDNLGDTIMATSVIRPLRYLFPEAKLGFWVKAYSASLFNENSSVDKVHLSDPFWDTAPGKEKGSVGAFIETWKQIKQEGYDAAFVLNAEWRRALACKLAGIPARYGYAQRKSRFLLSRAIPKNRERKHVVEEHRYVIEKSLGKSVPEHFWMPTLALSHEETVSGQKWIEEKGWSGKPIVVIHPFSGDTEKSWPLTNWWDLVNLLAQKNTDLRFAMISSSSEKGQLGNFFTDTSKAPCHILEAPSPFLKGVLTKARLFVGGDSGPGHLAAALGKPSLSLFGPTDPKKYAPQGEGENKIIRKTPLSQLSVADVEKTVLEILEN